MKQLLLALLLCMAARPGYAQEISELFCQMPDQYIPQLENAWRKDLVDLYRSGKEAQLKNNMGGISVLEKMTPDYLRLQSTERTRIEMRRFPLVNNTYVICVVTTFFGPVADSRVQFYSTDWKLLDTNSLLKPAVRGDFIRTAADTTDMAWQNAAAVLDMDLIEYRLDETEPTLTAFYTTPQYLSKEERKKVEPFLLTKEKQYVWRQSRFEAQ